MGMIEKFHSLPDNVKKSVADQMKLLSWILGAVNGYFVHVFGNFFGIVFIMLWWVVFQFIGHYILYGVNSQNNEEGCK